MWVARCLRVARQRGLPLVQTALAGWPQHRRSPQADHRSLTCGSIRYGKRTVRGTTATHTRGL
eukprot:4826745-Prymnesium_polylepis.1